MTETSLVHILEGAILAAGKPLTVQNMAELFDEDGRPENTEIRAALKEIAERCEDRGSGNSQDQTRTSRSGPVPASYLLAICSLML